MRRSIRAHYLRGVGRRGGWGKGKLDRGHRMVWWWWPRAIGAVEAGAVRIIVAAGGRGVKSQGRQVRQRSNHTASPYPPGALQRPHTSHICNSSTSLPQRHVPRDHRPQSHRLDTPQSSLLSQASPRVLPPLQVSSTNSLLLLAPLSAFPSPSGAPPLPCSRYLIAPSASPPR